MNNRQQQPVILQFLVVDSHFGAISFSPGPEVGLVPSQHIPDRHSVFLIKYDLFTPDLHCFPRYDQATCNPNLGQAWGASDFIRATKFLPNILMCSRALGIEISLPPPSLLRGPTAGLVN